MDLRMCYSSLSKVGLYVSLAQPQYPTWHVSVDMGGGKCKVSPATLDNTIFPTYAASGIVSVCLLLTRPESHSSRSIPESKPKLQYRHSLYTTCLLTSPSPDSTSSTTAASRPQTCKYHNPPRKPTGSPPRGTERRAMLEDL